MKKNIKLSVLLCVLIVSTKGISQKSSNNYKPLASVLEKQPEMDVNNDGELTEIEYQNFILKDFQRKKKNLVKGYYQYYKDISYAKEGVKSQSLDVIIPENRKSKKLPVLLFIHGGGWKKGDKFLGMPILDTFLSSGEYAGVSINYRLSSEAKWPAQLHDSKAAIRWVKANADKYGFDKNKICVWGNSAGGHIVAMLVVTDENKDLEGTVGDNLKESSSISCAIDAFGPTDFLMEETVSIIPKLVNNDFKDVSYNVYNLLEGLERQAKEASPYHKVHKDAKPILIFHGLDDTLVSIKHSENFHSKLHKVGAKESYLLKVSGLKHESKILPSMLKPIKNFIDKFLLNLEVEIPSKNNI